LISDRLTVLFYYVIVKLIEVFDKLFRRDERRSLEQRINIVQNVCCKPLKPLLVLRRVTKGLHAMNNRDKCINESISQLLNAFLALEIGRWLHGDCACREKTAHGAVKMRGKVFLGGEAQVTHGDHRVDLSFN
jgi:hypothetical protein